MDPLGSPLDVEESGNLSQNEQPIDDEDDLAWVQDWVQDEIDAEDMEEMADLFGDDDMDAGADFNAMVSTLQTLGVEATQAAQYVASLHKRPVTVFEAYGRGALTEQATKQRRNLNLEGLAAMDLRTCKPDGQHWDFTNPADQKLALNMRAKLKPDWIVGSPPRTD